jgi:hypothetical protein
MIQQLKAERRLVHRKINPSTFARPAALPIPFEVLENPTSPRYTLYSSIFLDAVFPSVKFKLCQDLARRPWTQVRHWLWGKRVWHRPCLRLNNLRLRLVHRLRFYSGPLRLLCRHVGANRKPPASTGHALLHALRRQARPPVLHTHAPVALRPNHRGPRAASLPSRARSAHRQGRSGC